jgi:hypothetical protein
MWQTSADIIVGPGLATRPAELDEVKAAFEAAGQNIRLIEIVDDGIYLIPLTPDQEEILQRDGHLEFSLKIPRKLPDPGFGTHIIFALEMP